MTPADRGWRIATLLVCGAMGVTFLFPWGGGSFLADPPRYSAAVVLAAIALLHALCLPAAMPASARGLLLLLAGFLAVTGLLFATLPLHMGGTLRVERTPAVSVFDLLWVALLLIHLDELIRCLWWLLTAPRGSWVLGVLSPGLVLTLFFWVAATNVEATWPGALSGGGALFVPTPVAIGLSACLLGFGPTLAFRLLRASSAQKGGETEERVPSRRG